MTAPKKVSARGVYYDLSISPYTFQTPYGEILRFSSKKKLEIYTRDVSKEISRIDAMLDRHDLREIVPIDIQNMLYRGTYEKFYKHVER